MRHIPVIGIMAETTFSLWRRQARAGASSAESIPQFAEVHVAAPTKTGEAPAAVTLHLPGGAKLEVSAVTDAMWQGLGLLLKTLHS